MLLGIGFINLSLSLADFLMGFKGRSTVLGTAPRAAVGTAPEVVHAPVTSDAAGSSAR